jgi:hypothetical protein
MLAFFCQSVGMHSDSLVDGSPRPLLGAGMGSKSLHESSSGTLDKTRVVPDIGTHSELTLKPAVHYIRRMSWRPCALYACTSNAAHSQLKDLHANR